MKKFKKLRKACEKYPPIELQTVDRARLYKEPKTKAKNGFFKKFCK